MKTKKIMALMIVLSMLVSIFPLNAITAFADDGRLTLNSLRMVVKYLMAQKL